MFIPVYFGYQCNSPLRHDYIVLLSEFYWKNKGITAISYNHLNLPIQVSFGSNNISYIYDATGTKLAKVVNENGHSTTTQYAGNYVYKEGVLEFFNTPEGYVILCL